jgi:TrmH family RNA methyltransferase
MRAAVAALPQVISSAANPFLKEVRRAVSQGSLTSDGCVVAESFHLLEEALRSGRECRLVLVSERARTRALEIVAAARRDIPVRVVADRLFDAIAATETSQGVIALVRPPAWAADDLFRGRALVAVVDGVQDPGNAGAIARGAEAFGATGIVFLSETVSPFNPTTLRASAGSLFRLPFVWGLDRDLALQEFRKRAVQVAAASSECGDSPDRVDWTVATAVVIGSEARGVSEVFRRDAKMVRIPTQGVESLNASIAAAVLLYEASRQRMDSSRRARGSRDAAPDGSHGAADRATRGAAHRASGKAPA